MLSTVILSLNSFKWGDVYNPTLYPAYWIIEDNMWAVEPFPLVPAIWIVEGRWRWGLPIFLSKINNLLKERSIYFGCRLISCSSNFSSFKDILNFYKRDLIYLKVFVLIPCDEPLYQPFHVLLNIQLFENQLEVLHVLYLE